MRPVKKALFTFVAGILVFAVIACSCSSLIPSLGGSGTSTPAVGGGGSTTEAIPGLAGSWEDPETFDVHTIVWENNTYVVTSTTAPDGTDYPVVSQSFSNNVLTWTYAVPDRATVTFVVESVSGDNLYTTWSNDQGNSGTETLSRASSTGGSTSSTQPVIGGGSTTEAIPGLAGSWEDPETSDVHTIIWQNNTYVVTSTTAPDGTDYPVVDQSFSNNVLTWTYAVPDRATVTFVVESVSGDSLYTTWSNDQGNSGTETLSRVP
jgi:hypothetical protein